MENGCLGELVAPRTALKPLPVARDFLSKLLKVAPGCTRTVGYHFPLLHS
jgi:hypothetical protein